MHTSARAQTKIIRVYQYVSVQTSPECGFCSHLINNKNASIIFTDKTSRKLKCIHLIFLLHPLKVKFDALTFEDGHYSFWVGIEIVSNDIYIIEI